MTKKLINKFIPKKINKINSQVEVDKILKKIKKLNDKYFLPESEFFMIRMTVYTIGTSKNPLSNIEYLGIPYKRSSNTIYSYHVELPKDKYKDGDVIYLTNNDFTFFEHLFIYYDNKNNENVDAYHNIMNLLSNSSNLIIAEIIKVNDQISNNENIEDIINYGNIKDKNDFVIYNKFINIKIDENNKFLPVYNNNYINDNYKTLSCLINIILEYKDCFEGKHNKGYRLSKLQPEFTYEGIKKILYGNDVENNNDYGATLKICEKFFEFGINVKVS